MRYEELRAQEVAVTAEELCKDCPELLAEVKQQIRMLASMNAILDAAKGEEAEWREVTCANAGERDAAGRPLHDHGR